MSNHIRSFHEPKTLLNLKNDRPMRRAIIVKDDNNVQRNETRKLEMNTNNKDIKTSVTKKRKTSPHVHLSKQDESTKEEKSLFFCRSENLGSGSRIEEIGNSKEHENETNPSDPTLIFHPLKKKLIDDNGVCDDAKRKEQIVTRQKTDDAGEESSRPESPNEPGRGKIFIRNIASLQEQHYPSDEESDENEDVIFIAEQRNSCSLAKKQVLMGVTAPVKLSTQAPTPKRIPSILRRKVAANILPSLMGSPYQIVVNKPSLINAAKSPLNYGRISSAVITRPKVQLGPSLVGANKETGSLLTASMKLNPPKILQVQKTGQATIFASVSTKLNTLQAPTLTPQTILSRTTRNVILLRSKSRNSDTRNFTTTPVKGNVRPPKPIDKMSNTGSHWALGSVTFPNFPDINIEDKFQCPFCSESFNQHNNLKLHVSSHGPGNKCAFCNGTFIHPAALLRHRQRAHANDGTKVNTSSSCIFLHCVTCGLNLASERALRQHDTLYHQKHNSN